MYTVASARERLAAIQPLLDELVVVRADAAELAAALRTGTPSDLGGLPELKARQARFDEILSTVAQDDVEVKGFAPLLLDFPATLDGEPVLLCWLEGERGLAWYHRQDLGFLGRRPLP